MAIALLKYREYRGALYAPFRGDARALSAQALSQTISFARISLIVGLVFLHYLEYPNSTFSPFRGLDVAHDPLLARLTPTLSDAPVGACEPLHAIAAVEPSGRIRVTVPASPHVLAAAAL